MDISKILSPDKVRERIAGLLATTRYFPKADAKTDKYGMPIIPPARLLACPNSKRGEKP
jgi:hypothetical protein